MLDIVNHRLTGAPGFDYIPTPNKSGKLKTSPRFVVIHYTAGRSRETTVGRFARPEAKASAHLVIGKDGSVTQMVDFDTIAWHAGESSWKVSLPAPMSSVELAEKYPGATYNVAADQTASITYASLNRYSIGIELDNPGFLERSAAGNYRTYWGADVALDDVILASHKHEKGRTRGWHRFPAAQLDACLAILETLFRVYPSLEDVVGHDDIAPGRKVDPGPAFPLARFRSSLIGRYCATDEA